MNDTEKLKAAMIEAALADDATFDLLLYKAGEKMEKDVDPSGVPLAPGHPKLCLGSGTFPTFECCCDNCDHFLKCFPGTGRKEEPNAKN